MSTISLKIEFGGGLELLFSNKRSHPLTLPAAVPNNNNTDITNLTIVEPTKPIDITYLMYYLKDHLLKERVELFMEKGTV
jgi:ubiquitin related modifier 1